MNFKKFNSVVTKEEFVSINFNNLSEDSQLIENKNKISAFFDTISEKQFKTSSPVSFFVDTKRYIIKSDNSKSLKEKIALVVWEKEVERFLEESAKENKTEEQISENLKNINPQQ